MNTETPPLYLDPEIQARIDQARALKECLEFLEDSHGNHVNIRNISEADLLEDLVVKELIALAEETQLHILECKRKSFETMEAFLILLHESYGKKRDGKKGNVTLMTFDGSMKVVRQNNPMVKFGPQIVVAKGLIDDCLKRWSQGGNSNLVAMVNHAFQTDNEGKYNYAKIMSLKRTKLAEPDTDWDKAMEALGESIRSIGSKSYVRFYKGTKHGGHKAIALNIAADED